MTAATTTSENWKFQVRSYGANLSTAYLNGQPITKKMPLKLTLANGKVVEVVVQDYTSKYSEPQGIPATPGNNWTSECLNCHNAFLDVMEGSVKQSLHISRSVKNTIDYYGSRSVSCYDAATYGGDDLNSPVLVNRIEIGK